MLGVEKDVTAQQLLWNLEMPHGHSVACRIQPGPLDRTGLRRECFPSLDTTQAKPVGNRRKVDPAGIMVVENPRR